MDDGVTAASPATVPILIIEDDLDTAESMARVFKLFGHEVQVAHNGRQAIELALVHRPRFVLLDLGLPGLDGYQVASRLRQECAEPLVIIAVTGYGQLADRERSREAGIDHHFLKPTNLFTLQELLSRSRPKSNEPPRNVASDNGHHSQNA
jgi:DNA-binding response OmpR family regulator